MEGSSGFTVVVTGSYFTVVVSLGYDLGAFVVTTGARVL